MTAAEWLAKHKPTVRARIERLNPDGISEGSRLRGWHIKPTARYFWFMTGVRVTTRDIRDTHKFMKRKTPQ